MEHQDTKLTSMCPQLKELNDNPYIRFNFNKRIYGIFQSKGIMSKKGRNVCSLHTNNSKPQE